MSKPFDREQQANAIAKSAQPKYKKGEFEKCIQICDQALAIDDFTMLAYYYKSLSFIALEKFEEVIKVCDTAIEYIDNFETAEDPWDEKWIRDIANNKGLGLFYLKRYDEAVKCFDHAVRLKAQNSGVFHGATIQAANNLGRCYYMLGNYQEALKSFDHAIRMGLDFKEPEFNKALLYQKQGEFDKALKIIEQLLNWEQYNPLYWNTKGLLLLEFGKEKLAARAFDKAEEYISKGVVVKGQTKAEKSALEKSAHENRNKLLSKIPKLAQLPLTDENAIKQRTEIFKEVTQALQDKNNNNRITDLLKRMEELEKGLTEVKQVGHFEENKKKEEEMTEINGNEKLRNYYKSFNSLFSRTYHGYITVASGLAKMADRTPTPITILTTIGQQVPVFGEIFGFFQQGITKVYEIKTTNEATRMLQLASNATEMEHIVENVTRALTLDQDKKQEILTVQEKKQNSFIEFFNKVQSKVYIQEFDTPEKQLAFKDASMLIMACAAGKVDSNQQTKEIEEAMLSVVVRGKFEQALLENSKGPKSSSAKTSSTETKAEAKSEPKTATKETPANADASSSAEATAPIGQAERSSCCNMF